MRLRVGGTQGLTYMTAARCLYCCLLLFGGGLLSGGSVAAAHEIPSIPATSSGTPTNHLTLLPQAIFLSGPVARQQIVVESLGTDPAGQAAFRGEVTSQVTFSSDDPAVARFEGTTLLPVGDGKTIIRATLGDQTAVATVTVDGQESDFSWNFRNHVQSVLTKAGCNSGACHGAAAGKKGFKLSLRGYDHYGDFEWLTRQARGRRITPADPGRSLILTKATGAIPHGGGLRFEVGSPEYQVLAEWIAAGTPGPAESDPQLVRLEVLPAGVVLTPGDEQQVLVMAHFSDGRREDVTRLAKYTSTASSVADVSPTGYVSVSGPGEAAISVWYASNVAFATITVPQAETTPAEVFAAAPRRNFIDELVLEKLAQLQVPPSPRAEDHEFLRRAYLDTLGILPTTAETLAFLDDPAPDKRDQLIEQLLARPEFVDYWSYKWSDLLLVSSEKLQPPAMWSYYNWIRNRVAAETPWDDFVRELITATGSTLENGATNYFLLHEDPMVLAENSSVAFLGMSINCARCHNHPLEKWTNDQYFGMANLFARVRVKDGTGLGNSHVFTATSGDLVQPLTGEPQVPTPLDGEPLPIDAPEDRRHHLADWLVAPENPYFSRAIVNRVWANFMGVGLVEAVDDLRLTNPPSNAQLMDRLAAHLVEQEFDLKALMRLILQSETYQRSSEPLSGNAEDQRYYSRYYPRRLMAEVLLDAYSQATGVPTNFAGYPASWRSVQLPDSNVESYFLKTFGRPDRTITCECERVDQPSMVQALHISNGDVLNQKLREPGGVIDRLLAAELSDDSLIEQIYLTALARRPTQTELTAIQEVFASEPADQRRVLLEDLLWGVMSSKEFVFNH